MRVAVITGGMGGLGDSISTKMHAAGYRVAVTHSPGNTKTKEWLSQHKASGREFSAYPVDVADFESCKECVARIAKEVETRRHSGQQRGHNPRHHVQEDEQGRLGFGHSHQS